MKNYSNYSLYSLAGLLAGSILLNTTGLVRGAIAQPKSEIFLPSLVISQNQPIQITQPKTAQQVAEIAEPITVQINSSLGDGSGVIIAHQGNVYTVLTVNHVVSDNTVKYSVRTSDGNNHPVTQVISLQTDEDKPDLAVVKFTSQTEYPVSILGNSEQAVIGSQIYVFGFPATGGLFGADREPELSPGLVTSRPRSRPEGYTLRYQAVTWSGMSGGPVFDADGRVIGIHGQGEFGFAQTNSGDVAPIKTGFNAAVPINTFIRKLADVGLNPAFLKLDDRPTVATPVSLLNQNDPKILYLRGLSELDQENAWEAIAHFNRALQKEPANTPEIYFHLGLARSLLVSPDEPTRGANPISDYTKAISLNPGYADAYYNRGITYYQNAESQQKKGDLVQARADLREAIADLQNASRLYQQGGRLRDYEETMKIINEWQSIQW